MRTKLMLKTRMMPPESKMSPGAGFPEPVLGVPGKELQQQMSQINKMLSELTTGCFEDMRSHDGCRTISI